MSSVARADLTDGAYAQPRPNRIERTDVAAHVAGELGLEPQQVRAAVAASSPRPIEVPVLVGPAAGYLPVVAPPTVDVLA